MTDWTEVNITPATTDHATVLATVVGPLVDGAKAWFFFWEPPEGKQLGPDEVIRLRIMGTDRDALSRKLDKAQKAGAVSEWYEGAHGVRGERYEGEEDFYGEVPWEAIYRDWHAHSELVLQLARLEYEGRLPKPRSFYWKRKVHLVSNQIGLPDARLCLEHAQRYMSLECVTDPAASRLIAEIDKYLYGGPEN